MSAWDSARTHHNNLPILGSIFESIGGSPEQEEVERTQARIQAELEASRPQRAQQAQQAMEQSALAFGPLTQLMGGMYGPEAQIDIAGMTQNPLGTQTAFSGVPPGPAPPQGGPQVPVQQNAAFAQGPPGAVSQPFERPTNDRADIRSAMQQVSPFRGMR